MKNIYRFLFGRFFWIQYSKQLKYKGSWRKGFFHGKGTLKYANGSTYTGDFFEGSKNGLRDGHGELFQVSSNRNYKGTWTKDTLQGKTEITDPNWTFHGSMEVSSGSGSGTFNYKDGSKYSGQVVAFKREGEGTLQFKTGEIISGIWTGNVNVKSASIIDEHGFHWMGDLHNMQPSGRMKTKRPDGIIYDSVWENGAMLQSLSVVNNKKIDVKTLN